ncbi:MAG: hypothetical protein AAF357_05575 [Verrucomicrobiota bacterium]
MGQKLPDDQIRLYRRIDGVLNYIWDPIGISASAWARDEYQSYVPRVFTSVLQASPRAGLRDYLIHIESEHMGLGKRFGMTKRIDSLVDLLFDLKEALIEEKQDGEQVSGGNGG